MSAGRRVAGTSHRNHRKMVTIITIGSKLPGSRDSVVGIATRYGLEGRAYLGITYVLHFCNSSSSYSGRIRFDSCSLYPQNEIGPSISSSVVLCVFVLLVYIVVLV